MTPNQNRIMVLEMLDALLRSWWVVVAGICIGAAAAEGALYFLEPVYESEAIVFANAARLPREMVRTTVSDAPAELQLGVVRASVLTRDNIMAIAEAQFVKDAPTTVVDELVQHMRDNVVFVSNSDPRKPLVMIRYRDRDRVRAADVTNAITDLVVSVNASIRADQAALVTQTVQSMTAGVEAELDTVNRKIRELVARYPYQTAAQRRTNEDALTKAESELAEVARELAAAKDTLAMIEAEREGGAPTTGSGSTAVPPGSGAAPAATMSQIERAEAELANLRLTYQDAHPVIQTQLHKIAQLKEIGSRAATPPPESTPSPIATPPPFDYTRSHAIAARVEVDRLVAKQKTLEVERDRYRGYLDETPRVQQDLDELTNERERLERVFQNQQLKLDTARTGEQIEENAIGNPFQIVKYATPSSVPAWPNRLQFLGGGVAVGLLLFVGPLLGLRFLKPVIASEAGLRELGLGDVPVLVSIPTIPTPAAERRARFARLRNWGLAGASLLLILTVQALRIIR